VRTGVDSRSELKFTDQTLARLGANTLFSFAEGTRDLNLQEATKAGAANRATAPLDRAFKLFFLFRL
jgi:hypothetical protein